MSPTQRSLNLLRKQGYLAEVTEKNQGFGGKMWKRDLFNFIDIVAIKGNETLGVQTTSGSNVSARIDKIKLLPAAKFWADSSTRKIIVHGWRKVGERGKRKLWDCRVVEVKAEDFGV